MSGASPQILLRNNDKFKENNFNFIVTINSKRQANRQAAKRYWN
jgi:hypothetical protein